MEGSTSKNKNFCACGKCGELVSEGKKFIKGHNSRGATNNSWKGGIRIRDGGYRQRLKPDHPFATKKGYVMEHRLVYEEYYNCILLPWAHVHHINEITNDNRIENLKPVGKGQHIILHKKIDMSGRYCVRCGSTTSALKANGQYDWPLKEGKSWVCKKCYLREYHKKRRELRRLHQKHKQ